MSSNVYNSLSETELETEDERSHRESSVVEICKMRGIVEKLESEIRQEQLNRISCNSDLANLKASLRIFLHSYLVFITSKYKREIPIYPLVIELIGDKRKTVCECVRFFISLIDKIVDRLNNPLVTEMKMFERKLGI